MSPTALLPAIFGLSGECLNQAERALFTASRPAGYILFARNCQSPEQLQALTADLHALHTDYTPLILIDQEGGRVARLRPPHWNTPPAAGYFEAIANKHGLDEACVEAARYATETAQMLHALGINTNCVPMCDVRHPGSHDIIGDRAYGENAAQVIALSRAVAQAHLAAGVLPVIKHIPGHGRAVVDSHESLPCVDASREALEEDFAPFAALADLPLAMTAHICYSALDGSRPATLSPDVIRLIREHIGFTHVLMSDDLCMSALTGTPAELALDARRAGCDLVLHCNGELAEMQAIVQALSKAGHHWPLAELDRVYQALTNDV
jgi:beta-N-acetylhexosaminidase